MNNLPEPSKKSLILSLFALATSLIVPFYAIFFVEDNVSATLLVLLSYTILRISTDYDSPFSMKANMTEYLLVSIVLSIILLSDNVIVSLLGFMFSILFSRTVVAWLYDKEIKDAVEKAMQSKSAEDALIAILRLKRRGEFDEENDIHKQLIAIYNGKGAEE